MAPHFSFSFAGNCCIMHFKYIQPVKELPTSFSKSHFPDGVIIKIIFVSTLHDRNFILLHFSQISYSVIGIDRDCCRCNCMLMWKLDNCSNDKYSGTWQFWTRRHKIVKGWLLSWMSWKLSEKTRFQSKLLRPDFS